MRYAWIGGLVAVMAVGACASACAQGSTNPSKPRAVLSKPHTVTLGEQMAETISELLGATRPIDAPMMAIYNGQKVEIWVFGARGNVQGAKESMETLRNKATPMISAIIGSLYGVRLDEDQIVEVYMNRENGNREIVRLENGEYVTK